MESHPSIHSRTVIWGVHFDKHCDEQKRLVKGRPLKEPCVLGQGSIHMPPPNSHCPGTQAPHPGLDQPPCVWGGSPV